MPALLLLALGSVIFYLIGGFGFSIIYLMLWIDKIIFGELKSPLYLGFELYSLPTILVGIMYGPLNGFLFGFFVVPIVLGMIDLIYTLLLGGHLVDTGWELFFPSPESTVVGILGVIAGVFGPHMSLLAIIVNCMAIRFILSILRDVIFDTPNIISYIINFGLTTWIAVIFQNFLVKVFSG